MTALAPAAPTRPGNRTLNVVRLQLINTQSFVWVPLLVLAGAVVVSLVIISLIPGDDVKVVGAANAPLWYFLALGIQAMTLAFPFSQAMSITRREFFVGTLIMGAIGSAMMATIFIVLAGIEALTEGFGFNGRIAYLPYLFEPGWVSAWLSYFTATMLLFVVGFWMATIWKRFGTLAVVSVGVALGLIVVGAIFVITKAGVWMDVLAWFSTTGSFALTLYGLALTAVLSVGAYATLRRATV
ncbi:MAG: hypothetical protein ACTMIH_04665 [Microbacterium gubbeenense]|uniref:Uncharacterized protein n=1 Tax=Candidatus Microbacterium stercoravium TaxID=2838697 RepID=A0A9D2KHU0_9MICO|nr:hypothetical protein [Microbacterium gubbeenense]HJA04172.1 hypothetical protein [Candidatus Microbacterium stercoravium]